MNLLTLLPKEIIDQILGCLHPEHRYDLLDVLVEMIDYPLYIYYSQKMITLLKKSYHPNWCLDFTFYQPLHSHIKPFNTIVDRFSLIKTHLLLMLPKEPFNMSNSDIYDIIQQINILDPPQNTIYISYHRRHLFFQIRISNNDKYGNNRIFNCSPKIYSV